MTSKFHTALIRLFFILIFASATAIAYILLPDTPIPHPRPPLFEKGGESDATTTPTVILRPKAEESLKVNNTDNDNVKGTFPITAGQDDKSAGTTATSTENFQTATLTVSDQNYTLQFNAGENLLAAMRRLASSSNILFNFNGKEYTGLGFFVEEINGLKNSPTENKFWIYYINNQLAKVGVSLYTLKPNDIINWKYENNKF